MTFFFLIFFSVSVCDYIWIKEEVGENFGIKSNPKSLIFFFAYHLSSVVKAAITFTLYFFGVSNHLTVLELETPDSGV